MIWIVAPFERNDEGAVEFVDHMAINFFRSEAEAREAVSDGLRHYPLVGMFTLEGLYDAEITLKPVTP